ncbi:MAG: MBL fold metallo-hydrolase [Chloroflexi bacterium]|nr:MBL fold metallo-hydrolase [Chloroflexota bacterium]
MATQETERTQTVKNFETNAGARIFQIPMEAFPSFWVYTYLVLVDDYRVLIDTGSNFRNSNEDLENGLKSISKQIGESIGFNELTHVFITHGHIDHFGGLAYVKPRTQAKIGIHSLDRRNLTNYEERLVVVSKRMDNYFMGSGVKPERVQKLRDLYMLSKALYSSVEVDFTYDEEGMEIGPFKMLHVPGHTAGIVVIRLHDILFSADHVISGISPHQAPESLTLNTGLGHYLDSLIAVREWAADVRLTLGSHKKPIDDLPARVDEIRGEHAKRLSKVMEYLAEPHTIAEVSQDLFGEVSGYNVLLALEEAGAHVEYLYQRGLLGIDNLQEIGESEKIIPIRYLRLGEGNDITKLLP